MIVTVPVPIIKITLSCTMESQILTWYDQNKRSLPWRLNPGQSDPYITWISEIMLQQTTVQTTIPYFERFMQRFPSVVNLAQASIDDVLMIWQGLGYYRRAHHMHHAAQIISKTGFPSSYEEWKKLPGIGPYTAGAITSIALGQPAAVVDGNVARIFSRYFGISGKQWHRDIWHKAESILPTHPNARPGCYTQALMDLGATICQPKSPQCTVCPLQKKCFAFAHQCISSYPPKKKRAIRKKYGIVLVFQNQSGQILIDHDPPVSLLKDLWGFPTTPWTDHPPQKTYGRKIGSVQHIFTHIHLHLDVWHHPDPSIICEGQKWVHWDQIASFPLSSLMKKIQKMLATSPLMNMNALEHDKKSL